MAILEIKIELTRAVRALERIADALDRAHPIARHVDMTPAPPENLTQFDPEAECEREQREERLTTQGITAPRRR